MVGSRFCCWILFACFLIVMAHGILFLPCRAVAAPNEEVVATVGGERFTRQDLENRLKSFPRSFREQYDTAEGQDHLIRELMRIEVFAREGEFLGLHKSDHFKEKLQSITKALLAEEYSRKKILDGITVTEEEARRYYAEHKDRFKTPEKISAPAVFIRLPADASPEEITRKERKANEAAAMLESGEDFRKVEELFSERSYREDRDYFARGKLVPEVEERVFALKIGEVSGILRVDGGLLIFRMEDRVAEQVLAYEEVKGQVFERMLADKRLKEFEETQRRLFEKYRVAFAGAGNPAGVGTAGPANEGERSALVGRISQIIKADRQSRKKGQLGRVVLNEKEGSASTYGKASFAISRQTSLLEQSPNGRKRVAFDHLKVGQWVEVSPTGPLAPSYPAQAEAGQLVILPMPQ